MTTGGALSLVLQEARACRVCEQHLPEGPRPILVASETARIVIIGHAPGRSVHESGVPWDDLSGVRLREWLGLGEEQFYDPAVVAIVPMGFCYPGTGSSGDLPPRPECAPLWHERVTDTDRRSRSLGRSSPVAHRDAAPIAAQQPLARQEPMVRDRCRARDPGSGGGGRRRVIDRTSGSAPERPKPVIGG